MKRIVISEEEKEKYELIAKELQRRALFHKRKSKPKICPVCKKPYLSDKAREGDHVGYCSFTCSNGRRKTCVRKKNRKKRVRQLKRQEYIKDLQIDFYDSREWKELRFKVLRKYLFACMACGRKPPTVVIHVDHIKPRSKYPELELSFDNLQLLCADCNIGKSNLYEDDLRPE